MEIPIKDTPTSTIMFFHLSPNETENSYMYLNFQKNSTTSKFCSNFLKIYLKYWKENFLILLGLPVSLDLLHNLGQKDL